MHTSPVLDESLPLSTDHGANSRLVKKPGWEELTPKFMLTANHIAEIMIQWAKTGSIS